MADSAPTPSELKRRLDDIWNHRPIYDPGKLATWQLFGETLLVPVPKTKKTKKPDADKSGFGN
jgi:hypothetical protein